MDYIIEPFVGVNEFTFGMSEDELKNLIREGLTGPHNSEKCIKYYSKGVSFSFEESKLVELSFMDVDVFLEQINLLKTPGLLELLNRNYDCLNTLGFSVYKELGIALCGFDPKEDYKTVTVFQEGYWDDVIKS